MQKEMCKMRTKRMRTVMPQSSQTTGGIAFESLAGMFIDYHDRKIWNEL